MRCRGTWCEAGTDAINDSAVRDRLIVREIEVGWETKEAARREENGRSDSLEELCMHEWHSTISTDSCIHAVENRRHFL